jgi:HEPN superfamily AbiU2-like protein
MRRRQRTLVAPTAPGNTEADFERELEVFRTEASLASQFFYAYLTIHAVGGDTAIHRLLNSAPLFWNTILGGLQSGTFVTLGRIFDQNSTHNIDRVLNMAQNNSQIFSKAALGDRKRIASPNNIAWLDDYLRTAYVPTAGDFRRLRKHVSKYRKIYEAKYRDLRHKLFAHKLISDGAAISALFAKTKVRELERMLVFLDALYECLLQMFINGRKPVLRPRRYSVRRMRARPSAQAHRNSVQERMIIEAEKFLREAGSLNAGHPPP